MRTPAASAFSIAFLNTMLSNPTSQLALMITAFWFTAYTMAWAAAADVGQLRASKNLTAISLIGDAAPVTPFLLLMIAPMVPARSVPWPSGSSTLPSGGATVNRAP